MTFTDPIGDMFSRIRNGYVAFYQTSDSTFLAAVEVGALPDSVAISPDGNTVVVAHEGPPSGDYANDPAWSPRP